MERVHEVLAHFLWTFGDQMGKLTLILISTFFFGYLLLFFLFLIFYTLLSQGFFIPLLAQKIPVTIWFRRFIIGLS